MEKNAARLPRSTPWIARDWVHRFYDSAGVATLENGRLERRRAEGKLKNLETKLGDRRPGRGFHQIITNHARYHESLGNLTRLTSILEAPRASPRRESIKRQTIVNPRLQHQLQTVRQHLHW
jgi:hypothetical protein